MLKKFVDGTQLARDLIAQNDELRMQAADGLALAEAVLEYNKAWPRKLCEYIVELARKVKGGA